MAAGEFYELPLTHKRVALLECSEDQLQQLSQNRRNSMYLLKHEGKAYNLDAVAFDEKKKVVIICASCYTALAHSLITGKPPIGTLAFYDYGIVPATLPELSLAEEIATCINIVIQVREDGSHLFSSFQESIKNRK